MRHVDHRDDRAEGSCLGFPYNTELVSIDGAAIHFWLSGGAESDLPAALATAKSERDIVCATWCHGQPSGFWAHQNIPPTPTADDLRTALEDLWEWQAQQGGYEAPAWARARRLLNRYQ